MGELSFVQVSGYGEQQDEAGDGAEHEQCHQHVQNVSSFPIIFLRTCYTIGQSNDKRWAPTLINIYIHKNRYTIGQSND